MVKMLLLLFFDDSKNEVPLPWPSCFPFDGILLFLPIEMVSPFALVNWFLFVLAAAFVSKRTEKNPA